jgi:hypothetical protein
MVEKKRVCKLYGGSKNRGSDRLTGIGWVCEDCYPLFSKISDLLEKYFESMFSHRLDSIKKYVGEEF